MNDLVVQENGALTAAEIKSQVNRIQEVMKHVMKEHEHYGKIPGTPKPSLWKPGAEKLLFTFQFSARPHVEDISGADEIRYRVQVNIMDKNGHYMGTGIGECSSSEDKYKWVKATCDEEWEETDEDRRRAKWKKGNKPYQVKQIRTNPADVANTILKMAKKRALIDATLTVTAASDIFTQDIEDVPEELQETISEETKRPPLQEPKAVGEGVEQTVTGVIEKISTKTGTSDKGEWTKYGILVDGSWYGTFSKTLGEYAQENKGKRMTIVFTSDGQYNTCTVISPPIDAEKPDNAPNEKEVFD